MKRRKFDFAVLEGDRRQRYLARWLSERGYRVCLWQSDDGGTPCGAGTKTQGAAAADRPPANDSGAGEKGGWENELECVCPSPGALSDTVCVLGPIPLKQEPDGRISELLRGGLSKGQHLFGGCIPQKLREELECRGAGVHDYMKEPALTVFNSIATAEGAIAQAVENSVENLCGSRSIVLGFGVCGKTLAKMLCGLGSRTAVFARRQEARQEAAILTGYAFGAEALGRELATADFIFNTVPAKLLKGALLGRIRKEAVLIDLATGGGFDPREAEALGLHAYLCPGLPGRYAPGASARAMGEFVLHTLEDGNNIEGKA